MGYIGSKPANKPITSADIEDSIITAADLGANSVDSSELVDGSIDTSHLGNLQVTTAKLAADAVDGTKLADDAVNSEHYTDGSIDTAHIADDQITLAKMASGTDGNIISYDASGNPVAIATGTSGHFLKSQGAGNQPVFAAAGGGKIGQVIGSATNYANNSASQSYFDFQSASATAWEVAITPSASSSKIAVFYYGQLYFEHPNNAGGAYYLQYGITINRIISGGSYAAIMTSEKLGMYTYAGTAKHDSMPTIHMNYLDSPSTTSECKYKIMGKCIGQASTSLYHNYAPSATAASHIMLMEVLA